MRLVKSRFHRFRTLRNRPPNEIEAPFGPEHRPPRHRPIPNPKRLRNRRIPSPPDRRFRLRRTRRRIHSDVGVNAMAMARPLRMRKFRSRRTSGPTFFEDEGTVYDEPATEMRPRLTPASRVRFRAHRRREFRVRGGRLASLSKLPIGGGVFADEGEFGIERDFTLAKGVQFRHRVMGIADEVRGRRRSRCESQAVISGSKGFGGVDAISLWLHLKPGSCGA